MLLTREEQTPAVVGLEVVHVVDLQRGAVSLGSVEPGREEAGVEMIPQAGDHVIPGVQLVLVEAHGDPDLFHQELRVTRGERTQEQVCQLGRGHHRESDVR